MIDIKAFQRRRDQSFGLSLTYHCLLPTDLWAFQPATLIPLVPSVASSTKPVIYIAYLLIIYLKTDSGITSSQCLIYYQRDPLKGSKSMAKTLPTVQH